VLAAETFTGDVVGERELLDGTRYPVARFSVGVPTRTDTGSVEAMALWAGESVSGVKAATPAAEVVRELAEEAERLLRRWCQ
jgi:NAD(P)H-dependent flavin oxidoreductase YrpB (nitropropane dioxygenase family)